MNVVPSAMEIALSADAQYPVNQAIAAYLAKAGHQVRGFGAIPAGVETAWAVAAAQAARYVADDSTRQGIMLCWSGTGVSIAANKVQGIRAALCTDPGTAVAARIWNHANVLCMSHRLLTDDLAHEILDAWFRTPADPKGASGVDQLLDLESRQVRTPQ